MCQINFSTDSEQLKRVHVFSSLLTHASKREKLLSFFPINPAFTPTVNNGVLQCSSNFYVILWCDHCVFHFTKWDFEILLKFDFGIRIKLSMDPLQKTAMWYRKNVVGPWKERILAFWMMLSLCFSCPTTLFVFQQCGGVPCDHILQRAHNIIITVLQKYLENYKTISL